jgi:hypothetical protein
MFNILEKPLALKVSGPRQYVFLLLMLVGSGMILYFVLTQSCDVVSKTHSSGCDNYSFQSNEPVLVLASNTTSDYYTNLYASNQFFYSGSKLENCLSLMPYMKILVFSNTITWVDTYIQMQCDDGVSLHMNTISTRQHDDFGNNVFYLMNDLVSNNSVPPSFLIKIYNDIKPPIFELTDANGVTLNKNSTFGNNTSREFLNNISLILENSVLDVGYNCHNCIHVGVSYNWLFLNKFLTSFFSYFSTLFKIVIALVLLNVTIHYHGENSPFVIGETNTQNKDGLALLDLDA